MKRLTLVVILLSALTMAIPVPVLGSGGDAQETADVPQTTIQAALPYPPDTVVQGAYLPPINNYGEEILAFDDLVGKDLGIVHYFYGWYYNAWTWLPLQIEKQVPAERRPYIMVSWVPVGRNCRTMDPYEKGDWDEDPSLYDIRDGYCDEYIRQMGLQLKGLPFTFMIRFGHEMNLLNQAWWVGHYNSDPQLFIDAYRRIYDIFEQEGITNVQWVWGPSYASNPREEWNSLFQYYPGDKYVDWVNIVAYNQGEWLGVPWWSLNDLLDSDTWDHVMPEVMCHYAKPIIWEGATVEGTRPGDGTKANWVTDAYQSLERYPFIQAVTWFNDWDHHVPTKADFRVVGGSSLDPDPWHNGYAYPLPENTGSWTQAYSTAIAPSRFVNHVPPLEEITPPTTWCGGDPDINTPNTIMACPGETKIFRISAMGLTEDTQVSLSGLPAGVTVEIDRSVLRKPWDTIEVQLHVGPNATPGTTSVTISLLAASRQERTLNLVVVGDLHRVFVPITNK